MADLLIVLIVLLIVGAAITYIIREKKRGAKCIGCPSGGCSHGAKGSCAGHGGKSCTCHCEDSSKGECCCHKEDEIS